PRARGDERPPGRAAEGSGGPTEHKTATGTACAPPSGKAGAEARPPRPRHGRRCRRKKRLAVARSPRFRLCVLAGVTWLALLLGTTPGHHAAAQLLNPSSENLPLQVQADSGIEWQQNEKVYIARGNAVATRGPASVRADTLIAHYREVKGSSAAASTGGNTEIYRV